MKLPHTFAFGLALIGISIALVIFSRANAREEVRYSSPVPVPVLQVVYREQLEISSSWPAIVSARRQSSLGFERGGLVAKISVDIGDQVQQGDRLASLNTATQSADLAAARANIAQSQAAKDIAYSTTKRQQALADSGHISSQRLEEHLANQTSAEAALASAKAQAIAAAARLSLSYIQAPFSGTIVRRFLDEGAIAGPGMPVLELVENDHLEVKVALPQNKAAALQSGQLLSILTQRGQAMVRLRSTTNIINPATQMVDVVFDFTGEGVRPLAGQSVRIQLRDQLKQRGFLVPLSALREGRRGLWTLYVLKPMENTGEYILSPLPVEIIHTNQSEVLVRGPIEAGTMFLRAASQNTSVGMRVTPAGASDNE